MALASALDELHRAMTTDALWEALCSTFGTPFFNLFAGVV
jgi:hypothetical protein